MGRAANDDLIVIECRLCPARFQSADAISSTEGESKREIVAAVLPALSWRKSALGWECPAHG